MKRKFASLIHIQETEMRKNICVYLLILSFLVVFSLIVLFSKDDTIETPYQYPIVPGTQEWMQLESRPEMLEACQIPKEILDKLSTDALLQTILDYPFLSEMTMFYMTPEECNSEAGFWFITDSFNGLQEFLSRKDALSVLEKYQSFNALDNNGNVLTIIYRNVLSFQNKDSSQS